MSKESKLKKKNFGSITPNSFIQKRTQRVLNDNNFRCTKKFGYNVD